MFGWDQRSSVPLMAVQLMAVQLTVVQVAVEELPTDEDLETYKTYMLFKVRKANIWKRICFVHLRVRFSV